MAASSFDATTTPLIDVHAHVVLEGTMGAAGTYGPTLVEQPPSFQVGEYVLDGVAYRGTPFMEVDLRLAAMAAAGIDHQVLSPNPLTYLHHIDAAEAIAFCRRHNDELAELLADHPERLSGFAALPLQQPSAAARELSRAVAELGLLGGYVGIDSAAGQLDDPAMDELYAACVELEVPLFIHPAPDGIDGPPADPRLARWNLDLLLGFAAQETLAVLTLIYGGVLHRHPDLDICVSHGGGAVPYLFGRLDAAAQKRPWAPDWLAEPGVFGQLLSRLWFDCHVHDPAALGLLADRVGSDRIVFGTNFSGWDQGAAMDLGDLTVDIRANTARLLGFGNP
ncbi:amidohydrolase family protein [Euzebya tangerina]|uniref:amidohydrolase family protein n=1 Tax=Euzebya tangerina TaxID=591198 RepID=UPI000E320485|nr:amidohydrolase family protein [Euzebya tangerina]